MLAVKYMHEVGIMHQDLKAENVFCTEGGMVKVLDFGLAAPKTENKTKFIGTIYYLAPEVIKGMYDERRDVWSIGVLFHMLLLGDLPFRGDSFDRVKQRIETQEVTIPRKSHLSTWKLFSYLWSAEFNSCCQVSLDCLSLVAYESCSYEH